MGAQLQASCSNSRVIYENFGALSPEILLATEQAANVLGVAVITLRIWRSQPPRHAVPRYVRFGRTVRYSVGDLRSWLAGLSDEARRAA